MPYTEVGTAPVALDRDGLRRVRTAFVAAAVRAERLGIELIQLHCAHGYLLHQFLSPLSNQRVDEYGGSLENRMRYPLEVFEAVREAFHGKTVSVRISGTDWVEGGWDIEQTCTFAKILESGGCDAIHISSGGLHPDQQIPVGPSYQVPLARTYKSVVRMPVVAVKLITGFEQAEAIIATGEPTSLRWRALSSITRAGRGMLGSGAGTKYARPSSIGPNLGGSQLCSTASKLLPIAR